MHRSLTYTTLSILRVAEHTRLTLLLVTLCAGDMVPYDCREPHPQPRRVPAVPPVSEEARLRANYMDGLLERAMGLAQQVGVQMHPHRSRGFSRGERFYVTVSLFPMESANTRPTPANRGREEAVCTPSARYWVRRHWYWPFSTIRGGEPFGQSGRYPRRWERFLSTNVPPRVVLELDAVHGFRQGNAQYRAMLCWRFFFDYYPWFLPANLSRPPWWGDRPQELRATPLRYPQ